MAEDTKTQQIHFYGWKPDLPDRRDLKFIPRISEGPLNTVMLIGKYNMSKPYDQGPVGSCTGNGLGFLAQFYLMNKSAVPNPTAKVFMPSRLFIYYFERVIEHTVPYDAGASIRDGIKVLARRGVCDEDKWPYHVSKFRERPSKEAIRQAWKFQALEYRRIDNTDKRALVDGLNQGLPIVFGFTVYPSFESKVVRETGVVPMPGPDEVAIGGHCTVIVGYNAEEDYFLVRNSWGTNWGINGYFKLPGQYVTNPNLADDFWVISKFEDGK